MQKVELYGPTASTKPFSMYVLAQRLNGASMDMDDALDIVTREASRINGVARVDERGNYIWFMYESNRRKYGCHLIRYRKVV